MQTDESARVRVIILSCAALWVLALFIFMRRFMLDDAYIGFTYLKHLLGGQGFVFNLGERIEGITNAGWLLFLIPASSLLPIPIAAKFCSLALVGVTLFFTYRLTGKLRSSEESPSGTETVLVTATSFEFIFFSFSGMETALLAAMLCFALWLSTNGRHPGAAAVLALAFSVRPETILIAPLWLLFSLLTRSIGKKTIARATAWYVGIVALTEVVRLLYYAAPLPNTFTAKSTTLTELLPRIVKLPLHLSRIHNIAQPFASLIAVAMMGFGAWKPAPSADRSGRFLALSIIAAGLAFAVYAPEDWTGLGRYFAPYLPVAVMLLLSGAGTLLNLVSISPKARRTILTGAVAAFTFSGVYDAAFSLQPAVQGRYPWYVMSSEKLVPAAQWIKNNTPPDSRIATRRIGCLSYYGNRTIFDCIFGLTDRDVARLIAEHGQPFVLPTHEALSELWRIRKPDYLIEDTNIIQELSRPFMDSTFSVHGMVYTPVKKFPINYKTDWILCKRTDGPFSGPR